MVAAWTLNERNPQLAREFEWWTRTQRIRTVAQLPFEVALLDVTAAPLYQRIAHKAFHLQRLGISQSAISRQLGVADKTLAKAIAWFMAHRAWEDASLSIRSALHESGVTQ